MDFPAMPGLPCDFSALAMVRNGFQVPCEVVGMGRSWRRNKIAVATKTAFVALGEDEATARVLGALLGQRKVGIKDLAARTSYNPLTVRRVLAALEHRGWVKSAALPSLKRGRKPIGYSLSVTRTAMQQSYQKAAVRRVNGLFKAARSW